MRCPTRAASADAQRLVAALRIAGNTKHFKSHSSYDASEIKPKLVTSAVNVDTFMPAHACLISGMHAESSYELMHEHSARRRFKCGELLPSTHMTSCAATTSGACCTAPCNYSLSPPYFCYRWTNVGPDPEHPCSLENLQQQLWPRPWLCTQACTSSPAPSRTAGVTSTHQFRSAGLRSPDLQTAKRSTWRGVGRVWYLWAREGGLAVRRGAAREPPGTGRPPVRHVGQQAEVRASGPRCPCRCRALWSPGATRGPLPGPTPALQSSCSGPATRVMNICWSLLSNTVPLDCC